MLLPSKCPSWEEDYNPISDSLNDSSCISQVGVTKRLGALLPSVQSAVLSTDPDFQRHCLESSWFTNLYVILPRETRGLFTYCLVPCTSPSPRPALSQAEAYCVLS